MNASQCANMTGQEVRSLCRQGCFDGPTAGAARGFVQANLVILRQRLAEDFERFCRLNPKPCPLLEVTRPGQFSGSLPRESHPLVRESLLAPSADLRTDLPAYRVIRWGKPACRETSIESHWKDDFVAFLIGCSFTFEAALLAAGLPVRHIEEQRNVPMFRTNIACKRSGVFHAPLVVSMRPMLPAQAQLAEKVTSKYPRAHGAPIRIGDPRGIGIKDLTRPDHGDAVTIRPGEIPVFWACGVTPMEAIKNARPDIAITHDPGHMLVTDLRYEELRLEN